VNSVVYQVECPVVRVPATAVNGPGFGRTGLESDVSDGIEEWRPVVGYEGFYEVSDHGSVRSISREVVCRGPVKDGEVKRLRGQVLKPNPVRERGNNQPHYQVGLSVRDQVKCIKVHKLVLEAFVGPKPAGLMACHGNGNGLDNRVENLRWDTCASNAQDALIHGHNRNAAKTHCPHDHEYTPDNTIMQKSRGKISRVCRTCRQQQDRLRSKPRRGKRGLLPQEAE
jgi:hypothetical protein